jgi:hypothetical protein
MLAGNTAVKPLTATTVLAAAQRELTPKPAKILPAACCLLASSRNLFFLSRY